MKPLFSLSILLALMAGGFVMVKAQPHGGTAWIDYEASNMGSMPAGRTAEQQREYHNLLAGPRFPTQGGIDRRFAARSKYQSTVLDLSDVQLEDPVLCNIAAVFLVEDPCPRERLALFGELLNVEMDVAVVGWGGLVRKVADDGKGKVSIEVRVYPKLEAREGGVAWTSAYCFEEWEWDGKELTFTKLTPKDGPSFITID